MAAYWRAIGPRAVHPSIKYFNVLNHQQIPTPETIKQNHDPITYCSTIILVHIDRREVDNKASIPLKTLAAAGRAKDPQVQVTAAFDRGPSVLRFAVLIDFCAPDGPKFQRPQQTKQRLSKPSACNLLLKLVASHDNLTAVIRVYFGSGSGLICFRRVRPMLLVALPRRIYSRYFHRTTPCILTISALS
jgi:hypothetical protein